MHYAILWSSQLFTTNTRQGRIQGLKKGEGSNVMYEAAKEDTPSHTPYHPGGGVSFPFNVFLDKTLKMYESYEISVYNTDFWEEYGLRPCPVLIRIC